MNLMVNHSSRSPDFLHLPPIDKDFPQYIPLLASNHLCHE